MSKITEWADQQEADLAGISKTLDTISEGIVALDKKIADFNNSPGTLSSEDQARLDSIQAASKALAAKAAAISTDANDGPPAVPETPANT